MNRHPRPTFRYLGHSTVRCDLPGGEVVLIDPWVTTNPACPEEHRRIERLDAVLITHAHADHLGDAVELCRALRPRQVVAVFEVADWLTRQGVENCLEMNLGGRADVLGLEVSMVRADHSSGLRDGDGFVSGGVASGYMVRLPGGYTFYFAGDTALFSDMQLLGELHRPELAFLPIGDLFTMDPHQAARACRFLGVQHVIPIHWGTFPALTGTPDALIQEIHDLGVACEVVALLPGETY